MRLFSVVVVLSVVMGGGAAKAECNCTLLPVEEVIKSARLVFSGTAEKEVVGPDGQKAIQFKQLVPYKGYPLFAPVVRMNRPGADEGCQVTVEMQKNYTIMAYGNYEDGYYTDACAALQAADKARWDLMFKTFVISRAETQALASALWQGSVNLDTVRELADKFMQIGSPEQAVGQYALAVELSAGGIPDLVKHGEALLLVPSSREALEKFDDVLEKEPGNQQAWRGRYRALAQLGRWSELPQQPGVNLSGLVLSFADIDAALEGAQFTKAQLGDVVAKGSLKGANFTTASIIRSRFEGHDFSGSKFVRAKVVGSSFAAGDFSNANFSLSRFEQVTFAGAKLVGANLRGAQWWSVDLSGADLTGANLEGVQFQKLVYDAATQWPKGYVPPKQ